MADAASTPIIADPNQEFSSDDYAAMEQALAARKAREDAARQALRDSYTAAARELVEMAEFEPIRLKVQSIIANTTRDDNMALHMDALAATIDRIVANVDYLLPRGPALS